MKERRSGSEGGHKHRWKYVKILSFLEPYVQERLTVSNFDQPSQTAESILNAMCENNEVRLDEIGLMCHDEQANS